MDEYMYIFRGGDAREAAQAPEKMQQHMQKWMQWMEALRKQGILVSGQPLQNEGKIVKGKQRLISDGPFTEGKEIVGGYLIVKAKDINEAVELSNECPIFEFDGIVEVRPVQPMQM